MQLTPERLAELRRIAEATTPGPWGVNPWRAVVDEMETITPICGMLWPTELRTEEQTLANAQHIATFDPPTVLALLDEMERLMERQRKVRHALRAAVNHIGEPQHPYERAGISHLQLALQVLGGRYDREGGGREYLAEDGDGDG